MNYGTETQKLLLRPEEAARALGVSRSKIYELMSAGAIPTIRVGRRSLRVPVKALEDWVKEQSDSALVVSRTEDKED